MKEGCGHDYQAQIMQIIFVQKLINEGYMKNTYGTNNQHFSISHNLSLPLITKIKIRSFSVMVIFGHFRFRKENGHL